MAGHRLRTDRQARGRPAAGPARPGQGLVRRLPHQDHHQARHRPQRRALDTDAYAVPDRIREQVILRDRTCVFPWCTRPARGCDVDHVIAYDHDAEQKADHNPVPTQTDNLAALCRFHHRLKTHTAWRYRMTDRCFEWTSPHGHHYRRDRTGTTPIEPATRPARHPATPPTMTPPHTPPEHWRAGESARRDHQPDPASDSPARRPIVSGSAGSR